MFYPKQLRSTDLSDYKNSKAYSSVKALLWSKSEKLQFFKSFYSFPKEIDKKEQIQNFYWLTINSLSPAGHCLFWTKLNELSENVSFDSEFALAFEIQPFKVAFFVFFLNTNFSKYSGAEWVIKLKASAIIFTNYLEVNNAFSKENVESLKEQTR